VQGALVIVSRRSLVEAADLPTWIAQGWRLVYLCPGGLRTAGPAAVIEWRA